MKVKVDVPATNGRKAYSYFREGGEGSAKPKSSGISKRSAAGLGAIALGGLAVGGVVIASANKKQQEESGSRKTKKALEDLDAKDREMSAKHSQSMKDLEDISEQSKDFGKDSPFAEMSMEDIQKAREGISRARKAVQDLRAGKAPSQSKASDPFIDVKSEVVKEDLPQALMPPPPTRLPYNPPASKVPTGGLTIAANESGKSSGSAIAPSSTTVTKEKGGKLAEIVRKSKSFVKEGWERDKQAGGISSLPDKEYDANQLAYKTGQGTRSAVEAVSNFAQSFYKTFVDNSNTVNTTAEEVKEPKSQKRIKGVAVRTLPQGGKRKAGRPKTKFTPKDFIEPKNKRQESLYSRIDSFVQSLR